MLLVSKALGLSSFAARQTAAHIAPGARSIHGPLPRAPHVPPGGSASNAIRQTRNLIARFFTHLTTPGFTHPIAGRSIHTTANAARQATIQQGLSLPARHALHRPFGAPRLPPKPIYSVFEVGLAPARKFSSGRTVFQHLIENVPVTGRSFYEAPSKVKRKAAMKENMHISLTGGKNAHKNDSNQMMKPTQETIGEAASLEYYFPSTPAPAVTTTLLIPLAPTPTSRVPLSDAPSTSGANNLLPISVLAEMHASHTLHSTRVSSLFSRLDAASVWDKGVTCSTHGDPSGLCTVLRVEFKGWTIDMVRGVIGEGGSGWCELEESWDEHESDSAMSESGLSALSSGLSSGLHSGYVSPMSGLDMDPAQSFVLPRLDFSSSFRASSATSAIPHGSFPPSPALSSRSDIDVGSPSISDLDMFSDSGLDSDGLSDYGGFSSGISDGSWDIDLERGSNADFSPANSSVRRTTSWMAFSSDFT